MMRKLRNIRRMRAPMIILVIVLSIGLVGSFTLMSSPDRQPPSVNQNLTREEQINYLNELKDQYTADIEANPENKEAIAALAEIHQYLGNLYEDEEQQEEHLNLSYSFYQKLLKFEPENLSTLLNTALSAHRLGHDEDAEKYFKEAIEIDPNNPSTLVNYGVFLMNAKGDFTTAKTYFNQALEQDITEDEQKQIQVLVDFAEGMLEALENPEEDVGTETEAD